VVRYAVESSNVDLITAGRPATDVANAKTSKVHASKLAGSPKRRVVILAKIPATHRILVAKRLLALIRYSSPAIASTKSRR